MTTSEQRILNRKMRHEVRKLQDIVNRWPVILCEVPPGAFVHFEGSDRGVLDGVDVPWSSWADRYKKAGDIQIEILTSKMAGLHGPQSIKGLIKLGAAFMIEFLEDELPAVTNGNQTIRTPPAYKLHNNLGSDTFQYQRPV